MALKAPKHIVQSQQMIDNLISELGPEELMIELQLRGIMPQYVQIEQEDCTMDKLLYEYNELIKFSFNGGTLKTYLNELLQFSDFVEKRGLLAEEIGRVLNNRTLGDYLSIKKLKPTTRNKKIAFLRNICKLAIKHKWLLDEIPEILRSVTVYENVPKALSKEAVIELLELAKTTRYAMRYHCLISIMLATGARIGEIATLRVKDIQWKECKARVFGKNHRSDGRFVFIGEEATNYLQAFLKRRYGENVLLDQNKQELYIFSAKDHGLTPPNTNSIREVFKTLVNKMTIISESEKEYITPHCLRHTYATNGLITGVDLYTISQLLGHRHVKTTARYLSIRDQHLQEATKTLQKNIGINWR